MSNWDRSYGYDSSSGNRVLVVEEVGPEPPYTSLMTRFSVLSMKLVFGLGIVLLVPLGLLYRILAGM